jgi:hypothetical protein
MKRGVLAKILSLNSRRKLSGQTDFFSTLDQELAMEKEHIKKARNRSPSRF